METAISSLGQLFGMLVAVFSAVWYLSTRLERLSSRLESHSRLMEERFKLLDKEMTDFRRSLDDARSGRVELWSEINQMRERIVKQEMRSAD